MSIRLANSSDLSVLAEYDHHIAYAELDALIQKGRVLIAESDGHIIGWLRWNLFWDNTPFMNLLFLLEGYRSKGHGKAMVSHWEQEMAQLGYRTVMTSTASDEYAQHFYRKLGYSAIGGFVLPGDPYELIFAKTLQEDSV